MPAHQFLGWAEKLTVAAKLTEILIFLLPESQPAWGFTILQ